MCLLVVRFGRRSLLLLLLFIGVVDINNWKYIGCVVLVIVLVLSVAMPDSLIKR